MFEYTVNQCLSQTRN